MFKDDYRVNIAYNPSVPKEILSFLANDKSARVRCGVAGNPNTPEEILYLLAYDESPAIRAHVASNCSASPELLMYLANDNDYIVRLGVARNSHTPANILLELFFKETADYIMYNALFENPAFPQDRLRMFSKNEDPKIRACIGRSIYTPSDILMMLAKDNEVEVRSAVATNPKLPLEGMKILTGDASQEVRSWAASNTALPVDLLKCLARDKSFKVRRRLFLCLLDRLYIPQELLEIFKEDKNFASEIHNKKDEIFIFQVLSQPSRSIETLMPLFKSDVVNVRMLLADSLESDQLLAFMANDIDSNVRCRVAGNINTSSSVLNFLVNDESVLVRMSVLSNPNFSGDFWKYI